MLQAADSLWPLCPLHTLSADHCRESVLHCNCCAGAVGISVVVCWTLMSAHLLISYDGRWCQLKDQFPNCMLIKSTWQKSFIWQKSLIWPLKQYTDKSFVSGYRVHNCLSPLHWCTFLGAFEKTIIIFRIYLELNPFWVGWSHFPSY